MAEVQSLKTETCKEIESLKDDVEINLLAFETFSAYCNELKLKGKPCDITRAANDLHIRATELLQNDVTLEDYSAPTITFLPMVAHELLDAGQNFVGSIKPNVNGISTEDVTHEQAVNALTRAGSTVILLVKRLENMSEKFLRIQLRREGKGLGFSIAGGIGNEHALGDSGIFISKIIEGGAAQQDGRLMAGDRLISVQHPMLRRLT